MKQADENIWTLRFKSHSVRFRLSTAQSSEEIIARFGAKLRRNTTGCSKLDDAALN